MKAIIVMSVKGGVGKTLVSANLSLKLAKKYKVSIIDADISSSNMLDVLGVKTKHSILSNRKFKPIEYKKTGIKIFSMAGVVDDVRDAVSKTGLEYSQILADAIGNTEWGNDIDYFIIDAPAGCSDEHKTISKIFKEDMLGVVLVLTPNTTIDAYRGYHFCANNRIKILGVVENMGCFQCTKCKEKYYPFGKGGEKFAKELGLTFFGSIPIQNDGNILNIDGAIDNIVNKVCKLNDRPV